MKTYTPEQYAMEAAKDIANKLLEDMTKNSEKVGANSVLAFAHNFVSMFIGGALTLAVNLESEKHLTPEEEYDFAANNFATFKSNMQNAISIAFGEAMSQYTGNDVSYYCQIKAIEAPTNKHLC